MNCGKSTTNKCQNMKFTSTPFYRWLWPCMRKLRKHELLWPVVLFNGETFDVMTRNLTVFVKYVTDSCGNMAVKKCHTSWPKRWKYDKIWHIMSRGLRQNCFETTIMHGAPTYTTAEAHRVAGGPLCMASSSCLARFASPTAAMPCKAPLKHTRDGFTPETRVIFYNKKKTRQAQPRYNDGVSVGVK